MAVEQYVVRVAEAGAADLRWVAYVNFDADRGLGEIRWQGGLEGQIDSFQADRGGLEQQFATWREQDGYQVDRLD